MENRFANIVRRQRIADWDVHVLAENGNDTGQELELFRRLLPSDYEFDVLVLVYCLNDISDLVPEWTEIHKRIYAGQQSEGYLVRHSYLVNDLYYRLKVSRDPEVVNYYGFVRGAYESEAWHRQKQRLRELVELCRARGIELMVVTFPFLHALGETYEYRGVHQKLGQLWQELGVPHLDLLSVYGEHAPGDLVIGRCDVHPNEYAHGLAARYIVPFIEGHLRDRPRRTDRVR